MLKMLHLGAALATVLSSQVIGSTLPGIAKDTTNERLQASTHNLVVTNNTHVANAASIVTADSTNGILDEAEKVDPAWLLGLAAVGGGVAVALSAKKGKQPFKLGSTSEGSIRIEQASGKLQKKLMRLLHDDRATANRLLTQAKLKHPDKSVDWYVDKVIYDLQRDRGSY